MRLRVLLTMVALVGAIPQLQARSKDKLSYGEGLIVNVPFPEAEVEMVVQDVADSGIIRGTKEYNKDEYVSGAKAVDSTRVFPKWTEGGKVFYKIKLQALDPRNFKESGDLGTLAVRYVLKPQGEKNTVLRIDAVFVEDFRKTVHASNGSVEGSEYKDIRDHLDARDVMRQQTAEAEREREQLRQKGTRNSSSSASSGERVVTVSAATPAPVNSKSASSPSSRTGSTSSATSGPASASSSPPASSPQSQPPLVAQQSAQGMPVSGQSAADVAVSDQALSAPAILGETLEQRVQNLRRQVERLVKSPGAPLKSAPFHSASTLNPLTTGTEVLILISTPYWYGVETRDGQHGWVYRDAVETLP